MANDGEALSMGEGNIELLLFRYNLHYTCILFIWVLLAAIIASDFFVEHFIIQLSIQA